MQFLDTLNSMDCFDDPSLASKVYLKPQLIDLTMIPDEETATHKSVALLELTQKHIRDRDLSISVIRQLASILKCYQLPVLSIACPLPHALVQSMLKYFADLGEVADAKTFFTVFAEEAQEYREDAMTIAEQLRLQGMQQGVQQGIRKGEIDKALAIARNMLAEGFDIQTIQKITALSDESLANLNTAH